MLSSAPHQDFDAKEFSWDHLKIDEMKRFTASGHSRGVIGTAEEGQTGFSCGPHHFTERVVGVSAGCGVGMQIQYVIHGCRNIPFFAFYSKFSYLFSTFTDTGKNPFKIDFVDEIFASKLRFSYGQRSKCADLLNSYKFSIKSYHTLPAVKR